MQAHLPASHIKPRHTRAGATSPLATTPQATERRKKRARKCARPFPRSTTPRSNDFVVPPRGPAPLCRKGEGRYLGRALRLHGSGWVVSEQQAGCAGAARGHAGHAHGTEVRRKLQYGRQHLGGHVWLRECACVHEAHASYTLAVRAVRHVVRCPWQKARACCQQAAQACS